MIRRIGEQTRGVLRPQIGADLISAAHERTLNGIGVSHTTNGIRISRRIPFRAVAAFSGNVWLGSYRHSGKNSDSAMPWVKVDLSAGTVTEVLGPPSNPVADNEVWFEKANTYGDARVDRVG